MKSESKLSRYRNPKERMEYMTEFNKENYIQYTLRLHKEKDKDIIKYLNNGKSLRTNIRSIFDKSLKKSIKKQGQ